MTTEIPVIAVRAAGTLFFDADCELCSNGVRRWGGLFAARGFRWVPLQDPAAPAQLGPHARGMSKEMKMLLPGGEVVGGMDAWVVLFRSVWWLWPLGFLAGLPGFRRAAALAYRWIARNRHCLKGHCAIPKRQNGEPGILEAGLLIAMMLAVGALIWRTPGWMMMWVLAIATLAGCKWLTYRDAVRRGNRPSLRRAAGYLFAWLGRLRGGGR